MFKEEMSLNWRNEAKASASSASLSTSHSQYSSRSSLRKNNVFRLLAWREISPQMKKSSRSLWRCNSEWKTDAFGPKCGVIDARHALVSWVEAESLQHLTAKYCPLLPPPRSTIAAAFSSDGKTLASTHGDHTVKIIDCQSGNCLKVLSGHRRTPWVVRFHPLYPEILASGSLDHEVRLWNASTADCIGSHDFHRPIASIAFHAQGELIAVASGHKLYIWSYKTKAASPTIVLKTRRSLRAVHFHPHAAPFLLTAEVNDLDSSDSPLSLATSPGYLQYPPAVFISNIHSNAHEHSKNEVLLSPVYMFWPTFVRGGAFLHLGNRTIVSGNENRIVSSSIAHHRSETFLPDQQQTFSSIGEQNDNILTPMETSPVEISGSNSMPEDPAASCLLAAMHTTNGDIMMNTVETFQGQSTSGTTHGNSQNMVENADDVNTAIPPTSQSGGMAVRIPFDQSSLDAGTLGNIDLQVFLRNVDAGQFHQCFPSGDQLPWESPFFQGLLMGQTHANLSTMPPYYTLQGNLPSVQGAGLDVIASEIPTRILETSFALPSRLSSTGNSRTVGQSSARHRPHSRPMALVGSGEGAGANSIDSEVATSLAAAAAAELPCTVKLRIWPHDIQNPCAPLDSETCRLTIPHAVLCSEMGAHFSPCGRFLAACVACLLPHSEVDHGLQPQMQQDSSGASSSPTRHPTSAHQVMFELRIYSLEEATFGLVLASRAIRAAHCLTSVQFSPTSEHILLAYGRRHNSLLRSIVCDGETTIPIYTILEVYRVSDMELVRVLPSAEDEVNVACFHPLVGGGLVYGTKEGKLRILQYDGPRGTSCSGQDLLLDENMIEVQRYALEG
uniref:Activating molecule in BECN1-regulated autophagy protein 1 n=1 Tax=Anthurium amnicola TaxID=1678845 RepID=A0A1D1Y219_9ARAE